MNILLISYFSFRFKTKLLRKTLFPNRYVLLDSSPFLQPPDLRYANPGPNCVRIAISRIQSEPDTGFF